MRCGDKMGMRGFWVWGNGEDGRREEATTKERDAFAGEQRVI